MYIRLIPVPFTPSLPSNTLRVFKTLRVYERKFGKKINAANLNKFLTQKQY
jgi:hypothetical protein